PLGLLYVSSHLKAQGLDVRVFDSTFNRPADFEGELARGRPPVVGLYCNLMTRRSVLPLIRMCRAAGSVVVVGGPDPANYVDEYLQNGADVVVIGEGELTLAELVPRLRDNPSADLRDVQGIAYRGADGEVARTDPRPLIGNLDAQPFPDRKAIDL